MNTHRRAVHLTVLISALGYFVDIYDLLLFGIVRIPSLRDLGVPEDQMMTVGIYLLNMQMMGLLLGGVIWGVWGDLKGRKSVLFGSILLYSLANIANAFVTTPEMYGYLRLIAGIGLAGELGAAVTLVSEVMSRESRGYGTAIVASVGILGAVAAALIGDFFKWKVAFLVGGGMGLALLALRAGMLESGLFDSMKSKPVSKGHFHLLLTRPHTLGRYLCCILIGVPIWFVIGILITFGPELAQHLTVQGPVTGSQSIMWAYLGLSIGDLSAGLMSQYLRSRKKAVLAFLVFMASIILVYVNQSGWPVWAFYALCSALGFSAGYWAVFVTIGAEQFGTNIRATVTTTVPNFVRGSVVPLTLSFKYLQEQWGTTAAIYLVGVTVLTIAGLALFYLKETFGKDLDYYESL